MNQRIPTWRTRLGFLLLLALACGLITTWVSYLHKSNQASLGRSLAIQHCLHNLRILDGAKASWAAKYQKLATDVPAFADLQPFLGPGYPAQREDKCPAGGVYHLNRLSEAPTCSFHGHILP